MVRAGSLAAMAFAAILTGCAGAGVTTVYEGTYVRTWVDLTGAVRQASGPVRLELTGDGRYELEGGERDLPPAGRGAYVRTDEGQLVLDDRAFTAAGFDLALLLEGPFEMAEEGPTLVLTQENVWGHTHHLMLEAVERAGEVSGR